MEVNTKVEEESSSTEEAIEASIWQQNEIFGRYCSKMKQHFANQLLTKIGPKDEENTKIQRRVMFFSALVISGRAYIESVGSNRVLRLQDLIESAIEKVLNDLVLGYEELLDARDQVQDNVTGDLVPLTSALKSKLVQQARIKFETESREFLCIKLSENLDEISSLVNEWKNVMEDLMQKSKILLKAKTEDTMAMNDRLYKWEEKKNRKAEKGLTNNALYIAILAEDLKRLSELLTDDAYRSRLNEAREFQGYRKTPLHLAVEKGLIDIVKLLVQKKAKHDILGTDDYSALHFAVRRYNRNTSKMITYLVKELKMNIEATTHKDSRSRTPLLLACYERNFEAVKTLHSLGALLWSVEADSTGNNALHIACERGHFDIAVWLCRNKVSPFATNAIGESPVYLAARFNRKDIAKFFFDAGVWLSKKERSELKKHGAAAWATVEIDFDE